MSGRESIENLWDRATPVAPLLDQYAHELAEKIRFNCDNNTCGPTWTHCMCHLQADIIDPEVKP